MNRRHPIRLVLITTAALCAGMGFSTVANAQSTLSGTASEGLIFVVPSGEGMDLWRARIADGALLQINTTPDQEERWPAWSEGATRLAYIVRNMTGFMKANIKLFDVVAGKELELGPSPDLVQQSHVWSPDGRYLAHTFRFPASRAVFITSSGAVRVDLKRANRVVLSKIELIHHNMISLDYSSDGKMILAHGRNDDDETDDKLWILQPGVSPRQLRQIPRGLYSKPHFTRDNKTVVFDHQTSRSQKLNLMTLELAPGARAMSLASRSNSDDHSPAPSPVRDEIVFVSDRDGSPDLFRVDLAGGNPLNLTKNSKGADLLPIWSPDGERIAYLVVPEGHEQEEEARERTSTKIRVIDRTGKILFETAGIMPNWMPPWAGDQAITSNPLDITQSPLHDKAKSDKP